MTTNITPEIELVDSTADDNHTTDRAYCCPYCNAAYSDERLTRVHITRADDHDHRHRNGLMPEEELTVVDDNGTALETCSERPADIDLSGVTIDDFPADLSAKRRHALVVATQHPEMDNRRELTEMVRERLVNGDWDTSPPSTQTVRRALDDFYHPHDSDDRSVTSPEESLADLTPMQQAIIIAKLVLPEEANTAIADRVGCASTYPGRVEARKEHVVTDLRSRVEQGEETETLLMDELDADALRTLISEEHLTDVPLDVQSLLAGLDINDRPSSESSTSIEEETDSDEAHNSQWGSPVGHTSGMQAAPETTFETNRGDNTKSDTQNGHSSDTDPIGDDSPVTSGGEAETNLEPQTDMTDHVDDVSDADPIDDDTTGVDNEPDTTAPTITSEITALRQQVAFFRRTLQPVSQADEQMVLLESLAKQVEQSCDAMLNTQE